MAASPLLYTHFLAISDLTRARAALAKAASPYPDAPAWTKIGEAYFLAYVDKKGLEATKILDNLPAKQRNFAYWRARAITLDLLADYKGVLAAVEKTRESATKSGVVLDRDDRALLSALELKADALLKEDT